MVNPVILKVVGIGLASLVGHELSKGGTMGNQVTPFRIIRKSPPFKLGNSLQPKRLYFMLVLANIGIICLLFQRYGIAYLRPISKMGAFSKVLLCNFCIR